MDRIDPSRRRLIAALLSGSCAALASRYWQDAAAAETPLDLQLAAVDASDASSFPLFLALSRLVTLQAQLDEGIARRMHPLFLDEPWGPHHIQSTYTQLMAALRQPGEHSNPSLPGARDALGKGQAWFASHLLTTWYLGVYYHERMPPVRVAYSEALMFAAVSPWLPGRLRGHTGFGKWGDAPESGQPS